MALTHRGSLATSDCEHLHHKAIVICHVVIVAELDDQVFLSGGATEFHFAATMAFFTPFV